MLRDRVGWEEREKKEIERERLREIIQIQFQLCCT